MVGALLTHDRIGRCDAPYRLCILLEIRLRVYIERLIEYAREGRVDMFHDKCLYHLESLVEIESSDECFEGIGEDVGILMSLRE